MIENTTMTVVSEEIVENGYNYLYDNNSFFQGIEKISHDLAKKDGLATNIASGLGEVTTIGTVSSVTGCPAAGIAGMVAVGKYTQEGWNRFKDTSANWTTSENYDKGIAYGSTNALWEMAQWGTGTGLNKITTVGGSQLKAAALRVGVDTTFNATDTSFRSLVSSRMFDTTYNEEFNARGGWSSVAADVGIGLLGSLGGEIFGLQKSKGHQETVDTTLNEQRKFDFINDEQYGEADGFKENLDENNLNELEKNKYQTDNEVSRMLPEATEGYIARLVGKDVDESLIKKISKNIESAKGDFEQLDDDAVDFIAKQTVAYLNSRFQQTGKISIESGDRQLFLTLNDAEQAINGIKNNTMQIADARGNMRGGYWQSMFGITSSLNGAKTEILGESISKRYNIDIKEGTYLVSRTNYGGGNCSVATATSLLGKIAVQNPEGFKKATGVSPIVYQDGKMVLNTPELFMESFIHVNEFEGGVVGRDSSGRISVNMDSKEKGAYANGFTGFKEEIVNEYLQKHGITTRLKKTSNYDGENFGTLFQVGYSEAELNELAIKMDNALKEGKEVVIGITPNNGNKVNIVIPQDPDGLALHVIRGPHIMPVKAVTSTGIICDSTWGYDGEVSWFELKEKMPNYKVEFFEIEE